MIVHPLGGSGGFTPLIVVSASTGSTVTCDGIQGTEVSGTWTFKVAIGTHTIVGTKSGMTATNTVNVDKVGLFTTTLVYSRLPSGWQEVEWIQSSGTQYINTDVASSNDTVIDTSYIPTAWGDAPIFGTTYSSWAWADILCFVTGSNNSRIELGGNSTCGYYSISSINVEYAIQYTTNGAIVNNTSVPYSVTTRGNTLCVFYGNGRYGIGKLKSFKITKSGTITRNFVPCYCTTSVTGYKGSTSVSVSAGTIGLYDLVGNRFYVNSGSGTFTKGADVII